MANIGFVLRIEIIIVCLKTRVGKWWYWKLVVLFYIIKYAIFLLKVFVHSLRPYLFQPTSSNVSISVPVWKGKRAGDRHMGQDVLLNLMFQGKHAVAL